MTRRLVVLFALAACGGASPRAAQVSPSARPAEVPAAPAAGSEPRFADPAQRASEHRARGIALYQTQRYRQAIVEFQAGYDAQPLPVFLFNIAQARRLDQDCLAVPAYRRFLSAARALPTDRPERVEIEEAIPIAEHHLAALRSSCATAMALPTTARPRTLRERPRLLYTLLGGAAVAGVGGSLLVVGELTARQAERAADLPTLEARVARARTLRISGGVTLGVGVATMAGAYLYHRLVPRWMEEVTVEVAPGRAVASLGGSF